MCASKLHKELLAPAEAVHSSDQTDVDAMFDALVNLELISRSADEGHLIGDIIAAWVESYGTGWHRLSLRPLVNEARDNRLSKPLTRSKLIGMGGFILARQLTRSRQYPDRQPEGNDILLR
jgi:hypothetical protein